MGPDILSMQGLRPSKRMDASPRGGEADLESVWPGTGDLFATQETAQSSQVKSPLLYSAFNNTNCVKATAQYQNRKIVCQ